MVNSIFIQQGFHESQRYSAAKLYDAAFADKLGIALPNKTQRLDILAQGFHPKFCWVAMQGDKMIGLAGYKNALGSLTAGINWQLVKQHMGFWPAIRALAILALLDREYSDGQLMLDGICIEANFRGQGVGTRLLQQLIQYANKEGYHSVRLDVIDSNLNAKRLYERLGFSVLKTESMAYLRGILGFSASTTMSYSTHKSD